MLRNNNTDQHNNLLHHHNTEDDLTVNISGANSHLGNLLLESNWDEVLDYLTTPEGQHDANANNDPLGLFNNQSDTNLIPSRKNTAFFAALFVRAPYQVIEQIYNIGPSHVDEPIDLMYVLSIIPSEEEVRLSQLQKKSPHRTRTWTQNEYHQLINLQLKALSHSSSLMDFWPSWIVGSTRNKMTPLAIAAYNPDVPANVVKLLCIAEPESIDKVCTYHVQTLPIMIAAASSIPPESSKEYGNTKNRRWEKVKILSLSKDYFYSQQKTVLKNAADDAIDMSRSQLLSDLPTSEQIEPQLEDINNACNQAMKHNEWELVREFLKQYSSVDVKIQNALAQHDEKTNVARKKQKKKQDREEWLHRNAGLLMYPIDAVLDLISIVIPPSKGEYHGIVLPMS